MKKTRWSLSAELIVISLFCLAAVLRLRAANPDAGTITPASEPVAWQGTAAGGVSADESTCVEGDPVPVNVNCDTFTLTVTGTPADWAGKRIRVEISWVVLASDYDLYIHKGSNAGPEVDRSASSAPGTIEAAHIEPGDLDADGSTVFTAHVVYFAVPPGDQYTGVARVITEGGGGTTPTPTPPGSVTKSKHWKINYHGTCCEGNLSAAGNNTYVLLPVLLTGNKIKRSTDGGQTWAQTYPPVDASVPYGIEGDMQAFSNGTLNHAIFFGTELADAVVARSTDGGATWSNFPVPLASGGNDQAWSYLGPLSGMRQPLPLPMDAPYVLAGWMRIGTALAFSFDGGQTWTNQTVVVGNNGSGPEHVVCHQNATDPPATDPGDTRVPNAAFANQKAGRHGAWGTDRKFYWSETVVTGTGTTLYVCSTDDFDTNPGQAWTGTKHAVPPNPGQGYVVTHTGFDDNGTLYVLHGNKLYISFNQGRTFAFTHTLPRWGNAGRSDSGADQYFVVNCGTIHIGLLEGGPEGSGRVWYLRGTGVDTATPIWDQELVDEVGNVRLDFMYIVLDGNGIPTISYTTPGADREVTTASRNDRKPVARVSACDVQPLTVVSHKDHGAFSGDINLLAGNPPIECRSGPNHQIVFTFPSPVTVTSAAVTSGVGAVNGPVVGSGTSQITVNLSGVEDAQVIEITLFTTAGNLSVPMGVLLGDINGDGFVLSGDYSTTRKNSGAAINGTSFRSDVNADGSILSGDYSTVRKQSGATIR